MDDCHQIASTARLVRQATAPAFFASFNNRFPLYRNHIPAYEGRTAAETFW
jgi:hypothetical protein